MCFPFCVRIETASAIVGAASFFSPFFWTVQVFGKKSAKKSVGRCKSYVSRTCLCEYGDGREAVAAGPDEWGWKVEKYWENDCF